MRVVKNLQMKRSTLERMTARMEAATRSTFSRELRRKPGLNSMPPPHLGQCHSNSARPTGTRLLQRILNWLCEGPRNTLSHPLETSGEAFLRLGQPPSK